jgi:hypothetical protein
LLTNAKVRARADELRRAISQALRPIIIQADEKVMDEPAPEVLTDRQSGLVLQVRQRIEQGYEVQIRRSKNSDPFGSRNR